MLKATKLSLLQRTPCRVKTHWMRRMTSPQEVPLPPIPSTACPPFLALFPLLSHAFHLFPHPLFPPACCWQVVVALSLVVVALLAVEQQQQQQQQQPPPLLGPPFAVC